MDTVAEKDNSTKKKGTSYTLPKAFEPFRHERIWLASNTEKKPTSLLDGGPYWKNSKHWGSWDDVENHIEKNPNHVPAVALHPNINLIAFDLDNVRDPVTGNIQPDAKSIIDRLDRAYIEISSSGNGFHIFSLGRKPGNGKKTNFAKGGQIELYDNNKVMRMTGHAYGHCEQLIDLSETIAEIYHELWPEEEPDKQEFSFTPSPPLTDEVVIEKCRKAKNADQFLKLFDKGDLSKHGSDASSAEMSLCCIFAFYTQKPDQIDRLIRKSKLFEIVKKTRIKKGKDGNKWDNQEGYSKVTIETALKRLNNTWQPSKESKTANATEDKDQSKSTQDISDDLIKASRKVLEEEDPCKDFSIEEFPQIIKNYIEKTKKTTDAHPLMLLSSILSTIGAYATKTYVQYAGKLFPNTYELILQSSGGFKSTAMEIGCQSAIDNDRLVNQDFIKNLNAAKAESDNKTAIHQKSMPILRDRAERSKLLPVKTTAERLFLDMSRGHKGLIAVSEFSGWLSQMEASYNKTLKATFTALYDCPSIYEVKTKENELDPLILENPYISILGFTAPKWLEDQVTNTDIMTGFFSRYLLFFLPPNTERPNPFPGATFVPPEEFRACLNKINQCEGEYFLSDAAKKAYEIIFHAIYDILDEQKENRELLDPFVKRWCPTIIKIALRLHLCQTPNDRYIAADSIRVAAYYVGYAIKSTLHIFKSGLLGSEFQRNCKAIINFIAAKGGKVKRQAVFASRKIAKKKSDDDGKAYDSVLDHLLETGRIGVIACPKKNDWIYYLVAEVD